MGITINMLTEISIVIAVMFSKQTDLAYLISLIAADFNSEAPILYQSKAQGTRCNGVAEFQGAYELVYKKIINEHQHGLSGRLLALSPPFILKNHNTRSTSTTLPFSTFHNKTNILYTGIYP